MNKPTKQFSSGCVEWQNNEAHEPMPLSSWKLFFEQKRRLKLKNSFSDGKRCDERMNKQKKKNIYLIAARDVEVFHSMVNRINNKKKQKLLNHIMNRLRSIK